jgi:hypothetical protein
MPWTAAGYVREARFSLAIKRTAPGEAPGFAAPSHDPRFPAHPRAAFFQTGRRSFLTPLMMDTLAKDSRTWHAGFPPMENAIENLWRAGK